jgi:hypothetical protein
MAHLLQSRHTMLLDDRRVQAFLETHRSDDGWTVFHFNAVDKIIDLFLMYIPDFLRDKHSASLKSHAIGTEPTWRQLYRTTSKSDLGNDLESDEWIGSMAIEWAGSQIHCYSTLVDYRMCPGVLIAAKCEAALHNFLKSLREYGHSRKRGRMDEVLVINGPNISVSREGWDDIVLPPGIAGDIRNNVEAFFRSRNKYNDLGVPYRRGLLFAGPAGCGKTLTVRILAATIGAKVITVLPRKDASDDDLSRAFSMARKYAPSMLVIEELEKIVADSAVSLGHFLNLVDGLDVSEGILLVATSNDPAKLDPALLHRPSRFDRVWKFHLPGYEERLALLRKKGSVYFSDQVLSEVARGCAGFSMAYVQEVVVNALLQTATDGANPEDRALLESLYTLKHQRRDATKHDDTVADRGTVGFGPKQSHES